MAIKSYNKYYDIFHQQAHLEKTVSKTCYFDFPTDFQVYFQIRKFLLLIF